MRIERGSGRLGRSKYQFSPLTVESHFNTRGFVPRKLRIQYPGAIYHLMNRRDQREKVFRFDAAVQTKINPTKALTCLIAEFAFGARRALYAARGKICYW